MHRNNEKTFKGERHTTCMKPTMPYQMEFPFTRNGALHRYNEAQRNHIISLWKDHMRDTKNYHYIKDLDKFTFDYVRNGGAQAFAEVMSEHYFSTTVERQSDDVWDRWIDNKLHSPDHIIYKTLDDELNKD